MRMDQNSRLFKGDAPSAPVPAVFDVEAINRPYDRRKRQTLYLLTALILGLSIEIVAVTITSLPDLERSGPFTPPGQAFIIVMGLGALGVAAMILSLSRYLRGALRICVDEAGVQVEYLRGHRHVFRWKDSRHSIVLHDYSAHPRMVDIGRTYFLYIPWSRSSALSPEAFQGLLAMAKDRGSVVATYLGNAARYGRSPMIYRIRGQSSIHEERHPTVASSG
jgi:hypothetical protein